MLLIIRVHCVWEEQFDIGLSLVDRRRVHVPLPLVLHVPLDSLFDFHDHFARQVSEEIYGFLLPPHTGVCLEEVGDVVVSGLGNGALENLTTLRAHEVGIVLRNVHLVKTSASNDCGLCSLLLRQEMAFDWESQFVGEAPHQDLSISRRRYQARGDGEGDQGLLPDPDKLCDCLSVVILVNF